MSSIFLLFLIIGTASAVFTNNCMKCICEVEGCESQIGKCRWDVNSDSCGPYQIKEGYWTDCGRPGGGWRVCTKQMACSETCVKGYMNRYGKFCTRGREPVCKDYAMIHNGGPTGCRKNLINYWNKVQACCNRVGGC
ncbi:DgyrCDS4060 [Dimorphilus gyrociliatus]|uniref:lysozyme n=1 Tax=Dimorphilus gyrociliatus TaxID=2664684 RepID=A0A7I8VFT1_9ANNE|nr:DgyrCDS4060 [Dimorphilus gyrociliatus]